MQTDTLLILDNNCLPLLERPENYQRFMANVRAARLSPQLSEVNLLEATSAPDAIRTRLYEVMRRFESAEGLLPWPFKLLQGIGEAIVRGETTYIAPKSGAEWYLDAPDDARSVQLEALAFQRRLEEAFSKLHSNARQRTRAEMATARNKDGIDGPADFLNRHWPPSQTRRAFVEATWAALGLPEPVRHEAIDSWPAWSLLLDAEGAALYERVIADRPPKKAERMDLLQLVYLAGAKMRILATRDRGLLRVGNVVLRGRYANARVVSFDQMIS